jgi:hypothetical protein
VDYVFAGVDVLRTQLQGKNTGARRRGTGANSRARNFIVDDVAFIQAEHGMQLGEALRNRDPKRYYLETRGDVLLRNKEVFQLWKRLGLIPCSLVSKRSMKKD